MITCINYNAQPTTDDLHVILLADFQNAPDVNWSTLNASNSFSQSLCNAVSKNNLIQLVTNFTHVHGNILDLVITNSPHRFNNVHVDDSLVSTSDHFLISVNIVCSTTSGSLPESNFSYMYAPTDFTEMEEFFFDNTDMLPSSLILDINEIWSSIKCLILSAQDTLVPKFKMPHKPCPKWFDPTISHQLNCTHTLRRLYRARPTSRNHQKLLLAETDLQTNIF